MSNEGKGRVSALFKIEETGKTKEHGAWGHRHGRHGNARARHGTHIHASPHLNLQFLSTLRYGCQ